MSKIDVAGFFTTVQEKHKREEAREHAYRPALETLLKSINPELTIINEPRRIECGSPDFVILRGDVPVGYVEAKDVGLDIRKMKGANKEQQERYRDGIPNLIYTNGLDWDFYRHDGEGNSQLIANAKIGDYLMGLQPAKTQFDVLETLLYEFVSQDTQAQTITSSTRLAKIMAGKAKLIRDALGKALVQDETNESDLAHQYIGFRDTLLHDIKKADFADIYAETIVYGMFAARYHDPTPENFSRQEALELLPKSNPFLRKLFTFIAAHDLDDGIRWIIDDLAMIFQATRVDNIMHRWSDANDKRDPFLHFYETFLKEYNNVKRVERGVWYTPDAVVNFIVRAVDDVLKNEFNEPMGLASTTKITPKFQIGTKEVVRKGKKTRVPIYNSEEMHKVQILDPATGTGTFLAEVISQIEPRIKAVDEGGWSNYVEHDLKPRLHGFELLMASYSMCHLKLDMMLSETGYVPPKNPKRLSVWLTNSLEEPQEDDVSLPLFGLARAISEEAKGASEIKTDKPIMCIIGNPPYSGESANKGEWIMDLMQAYKKEPGGVEKLKERNTKWINDDYVKFIRFAEHMIEKNGEGILGFITNHGYLDNPTFRGMRWRLLKTFDKIYVLDLHGNAKKKEVCPDGSKDENVFDIQQGVAIIVGIKHKKSKDELAEVFHGDVWGKRYEKYASLDKGDRITLSKTLLPNVEPQFPMVERNFELLSKYEIGFSLIEFMKLNGVGICSKRDKIAYQNSENDIRNVVADFYQMTDADLKTKYEVRTESRDQKVAYAIEDVKSNSNNRNMFQEALYRPFENKWTFYSGKVRGFLAYPVSHVLRHLSQDEPNFAIITGRQGQAASSGKWDLAFISNKIVDLNIFRRGGGLTLPLYLYPDENDLDQSRRVNMEPKIRAAIEDAAMGSGKGGKRPDEVAIFDYIYGVLHCPAYRETYAEFLKIDFPRVPYPSSPEAFWDISAKGRALRELHLMDGVDAGTAYPFKGQAPEDGSGFVGKIGKNSFQETGAQTGNVVINDSQYFEAVPRTAWEFYIGGYQPAQKWLKDRKGRELSFDDRMHYRKIIHILMETDRVMKTIEMDL